MLGVFAGLSFQTRLLAFFLGLLSLASASASANAQALPDIQSTRTLKVCIWPDYFGVSHRNPRNNALQGIDIDLSRAFSRDLGVDLSYVETDFSRLMDDLQARRCHIAMMAVGVTPQRQARVDFSLPYLRSDVYAVASRTLSGVRRWEDIDRPGRVVVVQKGTFMEPLMQGLLKQARLESVLRPNEREREVESGRADVFITDYPYSRRVLATYDWALVIAPPRPIQLTDYAYAVPKGDAAWLARVNEFVRQIRRDGRLAEAARRYDLSPIIVKD